MIITPETVIASLSRMVVASPLQDGVKVSTHVLYPSNGAVAVAVRGGKETFVVSDEGGAVAEMLSSGLTGPVYDRTIAFQIKLQGLFVKGGAIYSPPVTFEELPAAIVLVANASRDVSDWGLRHLPFRATRNFRKDLEDLLERHFHDNLKDCAVVIGASSKPHKFGHVIYLHKDRQLLIDPATNDAASINSRLVANLDVKMKGDPLTQQLIVFDDSLNWKSSDLKLLELGAQTVPFSRAEENILKLAA